VLPDGHEVKRSIRERHQPKRFTPLVWIASTICTLHY
jgi:hypothetical protein